MKKKGAGAGRAAAQERGGQERGGQERAAVVAWAQALIKGGSAHKALRQKLDKRASPLARFGLDALARQIVELAWAAERSLAVADAARAKGGFTVERLRGWLGDAVDATLSPLKPLRRHALVVVGGSLGGATAASDLVRLAPGLAARLDGAAEPEALWLGVCRVAPGGRGDVPARVAALLADLDSVAPALLTLDGCPRRAAHDLAFGLARRLQRGVLLVDGELLADAADPALLLACARREADCDGDALIVSEAAALGERWRGALAPPSGNPALVVLADRERTRDPVAAAPFAVRRLTLHAPPPAVAVAPAAVASDTPKEAESAPPDDGLDHIRQMAIRDAERALGIYRTPPPPPRAPVKLEPPKPAPPPEPPKVEPKPAAVAAPPEPPKTEPGKKRSSKGAQYFGGEFAEQPARATPAAPPTPAPVAPSAAAAPPAAAAPTTPAALAGNEPDGVPLPVAENAPLDELARVATTSPSAAQRIDLIGKIRFVKSAAVVAALRANAASAHPGVRAAAEAAMAALFGANWNVTRAVPKPVQPPAGDDKDRGPPGGW